MEHTNKLAKTDQLRALSLSVQTNGASTFSQVGVPAAERSLSHMAADPMLSHFPFADVSLPEIVYMVILKGTPLERAAVARHLTPGAALMFPSVSQQLKTRVQIESAIKDAICPMFRRVCEHYGVAFTGDETTVAYTLLTEFGGLSFADFMIMFERVKAGRYIQPTHHLQSRGVNYDFIRTWVDAYIKDREAERSDLYQQYKPENTKGGDANVEMLTAFVNGFERRKSERLELQRQADNIYTEWEANLYEVGVHHQAWKYITVETLNFETNETAQVKKLVHCEPSDPSVCKTDQYPVRRYKKGGVEKRVKKIIFEFICFGNGKETTQYFEDFKDLEFDKYKGDQNMFLNECKRAVNQFASIKRMMTAEKMVEAVLRKNNADAGDEKILRATHEIISNYDEAYFDNYLPDCIVAGYPRLNKIEYRIQSALQAFINTGFSNPYKTIFE